MSEADGKAIVRRFFDEAWNQNRVAELDEYISADNIHRGPSDDGPRGPEQIRQVIKRWRTAFPDFRYQIEALIAEDDLVTARVTMIGTHTGTLSFASRTLPPTGKLCAHGRDFHLPHRRWQGHRILGHLGSLECPGTTWRSAGRMSELQYLTNDNNPRRFTWTADPEAIIEKVRRGKEVLNAIGLAR